MFKKEAIGRLFQKRFPPMTAAWAYGSAVFPQSPKQDAGSRSNMVDLFFVVKDPLEFHQLNMIKNPNHYSGLSYALGAPYIHLLNRCVFPIHFNSHIPFQSFNIKYGVVSQKAFEEDLNSWNYLTIAGRLQKPVRFISGRERYKQQLENNLVSAMAYGLLVTEGKEEQQLYEDICRLSYIGDVRYSVNLQNKSKVQNIVEHNLQSFRSIYHPIIREHFKDYVQISAQNQKLSIDKSEEAQRYYLSKSILRCADTEELQDKIKWTNMLSSARMACYHALSSSWAKNFVYIAQKARKAQLK